MTHLRFVRKLILVILIFIPFSTAFALNNVTNPVPKADGDGWNDALGLALQKAVLDPSWADVDVIRSDVANTADLPARHRQRSKSDASASLNAVSTQPSPASPATLATYGNIRGSTSSSAAASAASPALSNTKLILVPGNARLASALVEFARANDWEIAWEIDRDFPVDYPATFEGPFLDVITAVVDSLHKTDSPIRAKIYHGNKVVRIIHATR